MATAVVIFADLKEIIVGIIEVVVVVQQTMSNENGIILLNLSLKITLSMKLQKNLGSIHKKGSEDRNDDQKQLSIDSEYFTLMSDSTK